MSIAQPVAATDPTNDAELKAKLDASVAALFEVEATAEGRVTSAFTPPKGCAAMIFASHGTPSPPTTTRCLRHGSDGGRLYADRQSRCDLGR